MPQKFSIGIDIGTSMIRVVCLAEDGNTLRIVGVGQAESKGIRHGYVASISDVSKCIRTALKPIEKKLQVKKMPPINLSIGGVGLSGNIFQSSTSLSKSEMEVTDSDVSHIADYKKSDMPQAFALNREIIHSFPLQYKVDGRVIPGKPHGLKGMRLESRTLYISCLTHHINDAMEAIEQAGYVTANITSAPIARANLLLSKAEKIAGVMLVDIGSETVSIIVYDNGLPISLEVFNTGSNDITNDLALGLKIGLPEAEELKKSISLGRSEHPRRKIDEIITKRLNIIFAGIEEHLKKIGKSGLLPAGIVISGGGGEIANIESSAKNYLKLPTRRIEERTDNGNREQLKTSEWAGAYGAAMFSISDGDDDNGVIGDRIKLGIKGWKKFIEMIKQFLP